MNRIGQTQQNFSNHRIIFRIMAMTLAHGRDDAARGGPEVESSRRRTVPGGRDRRGIPPPGWLFEISLAAPRGAPL